MILQEKYLKWQAKIRNLSGEFISEEHPFVKCELGKYFDHLKGKREKNYGFFTRTSKC